MDPIGIGQLIVAAGSLAVAISVARSSKQINKLVELIKEQKRQSDAMIDTAGIFRETLEIEKDRRAFEQRMELMALRPSFIKDREYMRRDGVLEIHLINRGIDAFDIKLIDANLDKATWHANTNGIEKTKSGDELIILLYSSIVIENIFFQLNYKDDADNEYSQKIFKIPNKSFQIERIKV